MKFLSTVVIFLALLCMGKVKANPPSCKVDGLIYSVDLVTGSTTDYLQNVNTISQSVSIHQEVPLQTVSSTSSWAGVLKITLPQVTGGGVQNRAVMFKLTFDTPESTLGSPSFHIGDSLTNNADGTDYAEVFNDGTTLKVYANQHQQLPIPNFSDEVGFISQPNVDSTTDILIGHQFIKAASGNQVKDYQSTTGHLFSLDGSDRNIFFSMNQKISGTSPNAKGLLSVEIFTTTCN